MNYLKAPLIFIAITFSVNLFAINEFKIRINGETTPFRVYYVSTLAENIQKGYEIKEDEYFDILKTYLSRKIKIDFLVRFKYSSKTGPTFIVLQKMKDNWKQVIKSHAKFISIEGDGSIVFHGSGAYSVPETRILHIKNSVLLEDHKITKYINYRSYARRKFTLYKHKALKEVFYNVKRKQKLTIVTRQGNTFFVTTDNGWAGWLKINQKITWKESPIDNLYGIPGFFPPKKKLKKTDESH